MPKKPKKITLSEKWKTVTAAELGVRFAKVINEIRSSNALYFAQKAFEDCEDDLGLFWEPFQEMIDRVSKEKES